MNIKKLGQKKNKLNKKQRVSQFNYKEQKN